MKRNISFSILLAFMLVFSCVDTLRAKNIGVPAECEDVMLQAFYWDSYKDQSGSDSKYGRTKWIDLWRDSAMINAYFDLVWLPPSAKAGTDGVGYNHKQLSNQTSSWGTKGKLMDLIATLHAGNTRVLADIVINHRANKSNWCDFMEDNFGGYGAYQLTEAHICSDDECFTTSSSTCYGSEVHGAKDTGSKFDGLRDLDHTSEYVQTWAKAYLNWMKDTMKYDGFRHDMTLGFHGSYLGMYNEASEPYLSVSELWEGLTRQRQHLTETDSNTMIFDFQQKYELHKAIVNGNYQLLKKNMNSFRGVGLERYAVTFIDNHDTFERDGYGNNQYAGQYCDLNKADIKAKILQAYAYILSMPGVPCVFWPHWKKYQSEINKMIEVRKQAGIHSESKVLEETSGSYAYSGTIQGHKKKVIVRLGKNRDMTIPAGYWKCVDGDHYTMYIEVGEGIDEVESGKPQVKGQKFIQDGKLLIRVGDKVYDVQGKVVE